MKIFLAGSIKIKKLEKEVQERIKNIMKKGLTVLVGDASGVDKNVQEYLLENNYKNVKIYTSMARARNNIGKWQVVYVNPRGKVSREKHTVKDIQMAKDADYGLMIWDGESRGTLNNVINLITYEKKVTIYLHKKEYKITSKKSLIEFIESLNEKVQKLYIKLINPTNERVGKKIAQEINSQLAINQQPKIEEKIKNNKKHENKRKTATYKDIEIYVKKKYNISIKSCWIAHMKEICGLKLKTSSNRIDVNKRKYPCPEDKKEIILEAFKKVNWID